VEQEGGKVEQEGGNGTFYASNRNNARAIKTGGQIMPGNARITPIPAKIPPRLPPHRELALMRELATSARSTEELARAYNLTEARLKKFAELYVDAIAEIARNPDDPTAGLWLAKRENRIAYLARDVEEIDGHLHKLEMIDARHPDNEHSHQKVSLMRLRKEILYAIGAEMLPGETRDVAGHVVYVVEADDTIRGALGPR
jgi:hypothetical protein